MAMYNQGLPVGYQPAQMVYPMPEFFGAPSAQMPQQAQQMMTPPTIRAEIVQVGNETAARQYPVAAGASQMMIAKDDSAIYIKTAYANAQPTLDVYVRKPPAPPAPVFDPEEYIRKDELEKAVAAILAAQKEAEK